MLAGIHERSFISSTGPCRMSAVPGSAPARSSPIMPIRARSPCGILIWPGQRSIPTSS